MAGGCGGGPADLHPATTGECNVQPRVETPTAGPQPAKPPAKQAAGARRENWDWLAQIPQIEGAIQSIVAPVGAKSTP